jgi:hypothetical protein
MKLLKLIFSFALLLSVIGCATTQKPIPFSSTVFNENKKIGIVYTAVPKATTSYTGSIGLLDYAVISAANEGLDSYLATLTFPEYDQFQSALAESLTSKGINLIEIKEPITREKAKNLKRPSEGKSKNDFSEYKSEYDLDMLILIDLTAIGTTRSYYGFLPTSEPLAHSSVVGQLIDLESNQLHWYSSTVNIKTIPTPWDEADASYPNLTTSVYQSLDEAFETIKYQVEGNTPLNIVATETTN